MVAISLYRGNLHRVPDVPRRWLMPAPKISLKEFKSLLGRRTRALSRLLADGAVTTTSTTLSIPNLVSLSGGQNEVPVIDKRSVAIQPESEKVSDNGEGHSREGEDHREPELCNGSIRKTVDGSNSLTDSKTDAIEKASKPFDGYASLVTKQTETIGDREDMLNGKEKRKKEVEDKLQVLNAKKHNLVLALKQILNVEEELKRRTSVQDIALRSSVPFQADGTNGTGSLTRHIIPRVGSEANLGCDVEGSENDDLSNHNMLSRNVHWMSSMSPSESPLRRTPCVQQNMVSQPSRASLGVTGSPSRFALSHQGNPMNPPSVSLSGTGYIASSPSPAASGGTSIFRDARHPSPWN
ncbi:uncharacterized protein LOC129320248 [Prosopis cineraria]|uniref:uncharacterized protein LOC129300813 n=1 Tax=Prosopis cineraria TaxID=364024 RepID=UPI00240F2B3A|nr:uncharacterized protein LOC129300813 [Prosopis cineraria]XP_054821564.1 uncharacterized protein LOC129320248 [Prosopis cineraria]